MPVNTDPVMDTIIASDAISVDWLFYVVAGDQTTEYFWSTKATSAATSSINSAIRYVAGFWNENETKHAGAHTFKVIDFDPIKLGYSGSGSSIVVPNDMSFTIENNDGAITASNLVGGFVVVTLRARGGTGLASQREIRKWRFNIKMAKPIKKTIKIYCQDFLQQYIDTEFPRFPLINDLFPDASLVDTDRRCIPWTVGSATLELWPAYDSVATDRYYIIAESGTPITASRLYKPRGFGSAGYWTSSSETFQFSSSTDAWGIVWSGLEALVLDSDDDGVNDVQGLFFSGEKPLACPVSFSRAPTDGYTNPARVTLYAIQHIGIPGNRINSQSFMNAEEWFDSIGLTFNGGYSVRHDTSWVINNLLDQCQGTITSEDGVTFRIKSKTSQFTVDRSHVLRSNLVDSGSFSYDHIINQKDDDGGYFQYRGAVTTPVGNIPPILTPTTWAAGYPQPIRPSREVLQMQFHTDIELAHKFAAMHFQRKLEREANVSFRSNHKLLALLPGDVITINHADYGGNYDVIIESMQINKDCSIDFKCVKLSVAIQDITDFGASGRTIPTDSSTASRSLHTITTGTQTVSIDSGNMPNAMIGKFRLGETTSYVLNDPDSATEGPSVRIFKAGTEVVRMGELNGFGEHQAGGDVGAGSEFGFEVWEDGNNYIYADPTNGIGISSNKTAAITIKEGGDIYLQSGAADGGLLVVEGNVTNKGGGIRWQDPSPAANLAWEMRMMHPAGVINSQLYLGPNAGLVADDGGDLYLGRNIDGASDCENVYLYASTNIFFVGPTVVSDELFTIGSQNQTYLRLQDSNLNAAGEYVYMSNNGGLLQLGLSEDAGGAWASITPYATIESGGFFGIGTANPAQLLEVEKDQNALTQIEIDNNTSGTAAGSQLKVSSNAAQIKVRSISSGYTTASYLIADSSLIESASASGGLHLVTDTAATMSFWTNSTKRMEIGTGGSVYINDTANAGMTIGLTVNQAGNDDEILALKSSDIVHGVTNITETDTYGYIQKYSAADGGMNVTSIADASAQIGLYIRAICGNNDTTRNGNSVGCITLDACDINGATTQAWGNNDNIFVIRNNGDTLMIFKGDGDVSFDGHIGRFDKYDDAAACHDLKETLNGEFGKFIKYNKEKLVKMGVITDDMFVSWKNLNALQLGAIAQLYHVVYKLCGKLGISYDGAKLLNMEDENADIL